MRRFFLAVGLGILALGLLAGAATPASAAPRLQFPDVTAPPTIEPTQTLTAIPPTATASPSLTPTPIPDVNSVKNSIDIWLSTNWAVMQQTEADYVSAHGRYWQGLWTHSAMPDYSLSSAVLPDNMSAKTTDQQDSWSDLFPLIWLQSVPTAFRIDAYDGPIGKGFVLVAAFSFNGTLYTRVLQSGAETYRAQGWQASQPDSQ